MTITEVTKEYLDHVRMIVNSEMSDGDKWIRLDLAKKSYDLELRLMEVE